MDLVVLVRGERRKRDREGGGWSGHRFQPPAPRARFCDTSRAEWGVRGLGGWGCVGGAFGAIVWFVRDVARWLVRSGNPSSVLAWDWAKKGSGW